MIISTVTSPGPGARPRQLVSRDTASPEAAVVGLSRTPLTGLAAATPPAGALSEGHLGQIVAGLGKARIADESVTFLIEKARGATPELGRFLYESNLVSTPAAARTEAERLVTAAEGRLGGAILLGVRGSVATFAIVDSLAPQWPLARKLMVAIIAGAIVAAAAFFLIQDRETPGPAPANAVLDKG